MTAPPSDMAHRSGNRPLIDAVYRNGEKTEIEGETLNLTLENREGIFVTVSF